MFIRDTQQMMKSSNRILELVIREFSQNLCTRKKTKIKYSDSYVCLFDGFVFLVIYLKVYLSCRF